MIECSTTQKFRQAECIGVGVAHKDSVPTCATLWTYIGKPLEESGWSRWYLYHSQFHHLCASMLMEEVMDIVGDAIAESGNSIITWEVANYSNDPVSFDSGSEIEDESGGSEIEDGSQKV